MDQHLDRCSGQPWSDLGDPPQAFAGEQGLQHRALPARAAATAVPELDIEGILWRRGSAAST